MKRVKGQPITGSTPQYSKKSPFVPDAKDTSADAQTMIKEAPMPFKNDMETPQMPARNANSGGISTMEPKISSGLKHSSPGVKALPQGGPVGQSKMPNQSPQIGGRMGWPPPAARHGNNRNQPSAKKKSAFYGDM